METRPGILQNGGYGLVFDRPRSKRDPVHQEGSGVPQNGGNGPPMVETGVLLIGRGVAYRKMVEMDLCWSATVETGVLFIRRGVAYRKTRLHGYCSSPPSTSSSLHGLLFIQPPPRATPPATVQPPVHHLLFIQPSTIYCSSNPPPSTIHPALHGVVLFIQSSTGSCSSSPLRSNA